MWLGRVVTNHPCVVVACYYQLQLSATIFLSKVLVAVVVIVIGVDVNMQSSISLTFQHRI